MASEKFEAFVVVVVAPALQSALIKAYAYYFAATEQACQITQDNFAPTTTEHCLQQ